MTEYRIVWRWPALCKSLHCVLIRTTVPTRIGESFKKELCQQFTVIHTRLSYQLDFRRRSSGKLRRGRAPPVYSQGRKSWPVLRHPLYGDTP